MKKTVLIVAMLMFMAGLKAQDCEALVLPYFGNSVSAMETYRGEAPHKFAYRCAYAQAAFYESDTVPAGAVLLPITTVVDKATGTHLSADIVINVATFSYYGYNFKDIQVGYPSTEQVLCFSTPSSGHPYLVLRSIVEMMRRADSVSSTNSLNR